MNVKIGNLWYFMFIIIAIGITVGLYFLLRNKSMKTKKIVLFCILAFNLILHFCKVLFPPYSLSAGRVARDLWFINICAVSVLIFPFIFISKNKALKDYMFYMGLLGGFIALVYPTEAMGNEHIIDVFRFYICHMIIVIVPLLTVLLKVHELDYRRIWKQPIIVLCVFAFIMLNQVLQSELGIVALRGDDIFAIGYKNSSLIWGPGSEADGLAKIFSWLTPDFMKTIPFGTYAGQAKYWPFFWLIPGAIFYFILFPLLLCLPWEFKHIKEDVKNLFAKIKNRKQVNQSAEK